LNGNARDRQHLSSREGSMTVTDIAHIIVEGDSINTLYLQDGRIARVSTLSGKVMSVVRLPSEESLQDSERKCTARRSRAVIAGSHYDVD
jgi:hypothetical protein